MTPPHKKKGIFSVLRTKGNIYESWMFLKKLNNYLISYLQFAHSTNALNFSKTFLQWYHQIWLISNLYNFEVIFLLFLASSFGDPHMTSLDGFGFSFNGLGDYVLYQSTSSSTTTTIHSRTCIAYSKVVNSKATVFCGYVLQETGLPLFEVYLDMES